MDKQDLITSLRRVGFSDRIINAFSKVPRELFVPQEYRNLSYDDAALPIGHSQTISQPYTIATMLSVLYLREGQKVLEIGSGSGYVLALLSEIVGPKGQVSGIEIIKDLYSNSKKTLAAYKNVKVYCQDGKQGLPLKAPFDRILISAALEEIPKEILSQLKEGGVLVAPIGSSQQQTITAIKKHENFNLRIKQIPGFVFVKFV
ncbi:protein-L-isoaspartate(D-aspartate) O-methyltransferase [Candidatus Pacearchaeota archaeon]|nr:protein-L-isoaspartate(D-aspartate) O-methyltransferase [Candidatus Pacearchaeota archaeon]